MSHMRSSLVWVILLLVIGFSQDRDQILFSHSLHVQDIELECSTCHEGVTESSSIADGFLPDMDTCGDCHDVEDECELCHSNVDEPESYNLSGSTSGRDFAHSIHLPRFTDCSNCHEGTLTREMDEHRVLFSSLTCDHCHWQNKPSTHEFSWKSDHGLQVALPIQSNCKMCHTEKFCDDCHHLPRFTENAHPSAYILLHGFEAKIELSECSTCHELTNDCRKCHLQQHVMPMDHNSISWTTTTYTQGSQHGDAAEDSPELCIVCHDSHTCDRAGCHSGGVE